jgi:hypothetical protein
MAGQGWLQSYAFLPVRQDPAAVVLSAQSRGGAILNQLVKGSHMVAPLAWMGGSSGGARSSGQWQRHHQPAMGSRMIAPIKRKQQRWYSASALHSRVGPAALQHAACCSLSLAGTACLAVPCQLLQMQSGLQRLERHHTGMPRMMAFRMDCS